MGRWRDFERRPEEERIVREEAAIACLREKKIVCFGSRKIGEESEWPGIYIFNYLRDSMLGYVTKKLVLSC